ncbi:restriction endonuclease subunit S [Vibrio parahaemolyticus]|uniref:restriction endonuclease subunit S n=1 Tax=Vibrio parahaemolyticus TaxID=670 RepID=UPI0028F45F2F|nr:restriction endonuclease subunit S [Vibrio parahaemolyticus]WMP10224.1 restriction endonuclease subunit S [Vibrio parahaemolyticus]
MAVDQSPMNKLITEHIDIWTSAVKSKSASGRGSSKKLELYGVKKLRELILELAVQGKLVPQDPSDEPASVLLERIAAEKTQLVREKKTKKSKNLPPIIGEEPFALPKGWEFIRWGDMAHWAIGSGFPKSAQGQRGNSILFSKVSDMNLPGNEKYINTTANTISEEAALKIKAKLHPKGTVIFPKIGGAIATNKRRILTRSSAMDNNCLGLIPSVGITTDYLYLILNSTDLVAYQAGTSVPALSQSTLELIVAALPPLSEQHRIVAKVDELMTLCDQLEQQTEASIEAHQVLVTTLLDTLTNSANADELMQNWARISEHFDTLFTTEESIDQLKQTILQLAVMGKLVPQDPSDEPAAELLKRIADEKAQLVKDKVYQKTSKLKPRNELISYPKGWVGVQIGQVCPSIVPNRDRPKSFTGNIPWVTLPAFPQESLYLDSTKVELALTETEVQKYSARLIPEGSVLMSCVGRFGLTAINTIPVTSNQQVHAFITLKGLLPEYLSMVIRVEGKVLETIATSTTIAYLNKTNCESIQFGLPPENEQRLIVEKAKELIELCEQLKVRVKEFQATQHNLTDAIVEQAI